MPTPKIGETLKGRVGYVIDGNTFYFSNDFGKTKVQIAGTQVPGMKEDHGFASFEFLRKLIHYQEVEITITETSPHWKADVRVKELDVANQMIQEGMAYWDGVGDQADKKSLENEAKNAQKGLWKTL